MKRFTLVNAFLIAYFLRTLVKEVDNRPPIRFFHEALEFLVEVVALHLPAVGRNFGDADHDRAVRAERFQPLDDRVDGLGELRITDLNAPVDDLLKGGGQFRAFVPAEGEDDGREGLGEV